MLLELEHLFLRCHALGDLLGDELLGIHLLRDVLDLE